MCTKYRRKMSSTSSPSLPTPQQLLTSLLDTIAAIPAPDAEQETTNQQKGSKATVGWIPKRIGPPSPSNPLKLLDPSHRKYFLTLHVLFPSLLLPALDLLDRGLVARLSLPIAQPSSSHDEETSTIKRQVYHVKSAAVQKKSYKRGAGAGAGGGGGRHRFADGGFDTGDSEGGSTTPIPNNTTSTFYIVHTAAWNCTCAAFAFAAFPPLPYEANLMTTATATKSFCMRESGGEDEEQETMMMDEKPRFGGLSFGQEEEGGGGMPPCCKHLLACVLAELWDVVLGRYVAQRKVTKEEMAGIFADI